MERTADPGSRPGMADHAPNQRWWRRGRARRAKPARRDFRDSGRPEVLEAEGIIYGAFFLRLRMSSGALSPSFAAELAVSRS